MKRIISFLICMLMLLMLCACGRGSLFKNLSYNEDFSSDIPQNDIVAAENENYSLMWDSINERVRFYDKTMNTYWSYTPRTALQKRISEDGLELNNNPQLESPIIVTYYDSEKGIIDTAVASTASIKKRTYSIDNNDNTLTMVLAFEKQEIEVTVDFILRSNSVAISIDPKKIREGKYTVVSIGIAPFFCSVKNKTDDSYLFFPSGCGALINADDSLDEINIISEKVYGNDATRPSDDVLKNVSSGVKMPVFGAKEAEYAVIGIIEKNAGSAEIVANVGNSVIGYSAVYASFNVRSEQLVLTNNGNGQRTKYSDDMTITPITIGYYPLYGDNANYVGMANCYRDYLKTNDLMQSDECQTDVTLRVLGATQYTKSVLGVSYSSLKPITTVSQAEKIVSEIKDATSASVAVQLYGYGASGTDIGKLAGDFKLSGILGNSKDLKNFSSYCQDNNYPLYMDFDLLQYSTSSSFAKVGRDSALDTTGRRVFLYHYLIWSGTRDMSSRGWNNKSSYTLLKRSLIPMAIKKMQEAADDYSINGLSISTLSRIAYSDHSEQKYYSKGLISEQISKEIKKIREQNNVMVSDANAYSAANSTMIIDAPTVSSRYDLFDVDIPFYQIVFKGIIPLSNKPINLDINNQIALLKCVESGSGLSYVVSFDYDTDLFQNESVLFCASKYEDLKGEIITTLKKNKDYFTAISSSKIKEHTVITKDVRKTVFDNGIIVYINYSNESFETPLGVLSPFDYIYAKEEDYTS